MIVSVPVVVVVVILVASKDLIVLIVILGVTTVVLIGLNVVRRVLSITGRRVMLVIVLVVGFLKLHATKMK